MRSLLASLAALLVAAVLAGPAPAAPAARAQKIIFLHHSTGENIWKGGVSDWFRRHNAKQKTAYQITELAFPKEKPYGWNNYPYDYWNLWVKHGGPAKYKAEPTLEILTRQYDVIVFKHCFPASNVVADAGKADPASDEKTLGNYKAQYEALKKKLRQFPKARFIVWTGAAQVKAETNEADAQRAKQFFEWVRRTWDEKGDNIFLWDFQQLETEGGLYLKSEHAVGEGDSHPNPAFARRVAPLLGKRIVDVIEGRGDAGSLTGR